MSYSVKVRLSSKPEDLDAEVQLKKLMKNKITHRKFKPSLCNNLNIPHFKEIMKKQGMKVDLDKDYKEHLNKVIRNMNGFKLRSKSLVEQEKIDHPLDIKTSGDAKEYAKQITNEKMY